MCNDQIFSHQYFKCDNKTNFRVNSYSLKEMISQTDYFLIILSSKTCVFEDKMTKY